jgi:hypothetical protein
VLLGAALVGQVVLLSLLLLGVFDFATSNSEGIAILLPQTKSCRKITSNVTFIGAVKVFEAFWNAFCIHKVQIVGTEVVPLRTVVQTVVLHG